MKRLILASILGGLTAFIWSAISHMALPLGQAGVRVLPAESEVLDLLSRTTKENAVYIFPGLDPGNASETEQRKWMERYRTGPTGILVYTAVGGEFNFPLHLVAELGTNIFAALIASLIIFRVVASYRMRALFVGLLGLFAWSSISLSYWNWYRFPPPFVLAEGLDQFLGWLVAGFVIARFAPPAQMLQPDVR